MRLHPNQRRRLPEHEFRRIIDEARDQYRLSDIVGRRTAMKRVGNEHRGLCVFHQERTPSMYVNDAEGVYHCFGCGASGDIIRFVMDAEGCTFLEALEWLGAAQLPIVLEAERVKRAAENAAARAAAIAEARDIWDRSIDPIGTAAERYARVRGITMPLPPTIRFAMTPRWRDRDTGEVGPDTPALVGLVTKGDEPVAVQCIYLRDGGRAKALGKRPKLSRGRILGGVLRLDHGRPPSDEVIITEGPEDALTLAQELPGKRVWACLGTAMMPAIEYPRDVRRIVIAGQNDGPGRLAVRNASARLTDMGFHVGQMWPGPEFKDWNDQLRGIAK